MRELNLVATGRLAWVERADPQLEDPGDAIVRPFVAGRCDGDVLPIHRHVSRAMQIGLRAGLIDPAVGQICGPVPFKGPFAIGHECVAEVVEVGDAVENLAVGDRVIVPWSVSCGRCDTCRRGLTSKCTTTRAGRTLAAYGFGPASGDFGGMVSDLLRVPFAEHMLVRLPADLDPLRMAAASDNLSDAWRCVAPPLRALPEARVLVVGGGAQSIGIYAAGLAVALGAPTTYVDSSEHRLCIARSLGADAQKRARRAVHPGASHDVVVEASSSAAGVRYALRATAPGGVCTAVGYYIATNTRVPLMHMYANDVTLRLGISHPRAVLPELIDFMRQRQFPAEKVTTRLADWGDAPSAYAEHTTKLVLYRAPVIR